VPDVPERSEIVRRLGDVTDRYGEWTYDVPLPHGIWTKGNLEVPHTRLKRIVQAACDIAGKPLSSCRILDLGCLEGQFTAEFALQGADALGVEVRTANFEKAKLLEWALALPNLAFIQEDVRNITVEKHGEFDVVVCSGLLYHLPAKDAFDLVRSMFAMAQRIVIIDTHIALAPETNVTIDGETYSGRYFVEHRQDATDAEKAASLWASADNTTSFWFTRPSLVNIMQRAGFSTVYECFTPAHLNYGRPGLECPDRGTFVGVKGSPVKLATSPAANGIREDWPEGTLAYAPPPPRLLRAATRLGRLIGLPGVARSARGRR
jgi:SAM-dependent methyltransferase